MKKSIWLSIILFLFIIVLAGCAKKETESLPSDIEVTSAQQYTVHMKSTGFEPAELSIHPGDMVEFVNDDTVAHQPASGMHPTHQICAGFDAMAGVAPGSSYSFKFTIAKECPMHDHLNPTLKGKITVK